MILSPLLNREGQIPADQWFHLVPKGEFLHPPTGYTQVVDQKSLDAILNRFQEEAKHPNFGGIRIDQDHFSYDLSKPSESYGWVRELQNRADGIWGRIEFSDIGEAAVKNRRYKFVSPVFWPRDTIEVLAANKVRPHRVDSFGLTNDPQMKGMAPFTNRNFPDDAGASSAEHRTVNQKLVMKTIAQRLKLSADASEDAVLAEVDKLMNRAAQAEEALAALKPEITELKNRNAAMLDDQIAAELDAAGIADEGKRERLTKVLKPMANREERVEFLQDVAPEHAEDKSDRSVRTPLLNRAGTRTPAQRPNGNSEEDPKKIAAAQHSAIEEIRLQNRCSYEDAQRLAMTRKPELFNPIR